MVGREDTELAGALTCVFIDKHGIDKMKLTFKCPLCDQWIGNGLEVHLQVRVP